MWPFKSRRKIVLYQVGNAPLEKFKSGDIVTSVWLNREKDGKHIFQVSYGRLEPNGSERKSFYVDDLYHMMRGTEMAIKWMRKGPRIAR